MAKKAFFGQKMTIFKPKKMTKCAQIIFFSVIFLQFVAKFRQRGKTKKKMTKKGVFGPKKGHFFTQKKDQNRFFSQTYSLTIFN